METRSTSVIMTEAMRCLLDNLGVIETEIFISNVIKEQFDYTKWQRDYFDKFSPQELNSRAVEYCKNNPIK